MKRLLYITVLICFIATTHALRLNATAQAQSNIITSPMGGIVSISPGITITQASPSTVFYTETIPANTLLPNRWYTLHQSFQLTTPALIGIPGLSITVQFGSQTYNIMSSAPLIGGSNGGLFKIDLNLISVTNTTQKIEAIITQPNGALITLGSGYFPVGNFTANNAVDNNFIVSMNFTGVSLGASSLVNYWTMREPY